MSEHSRTPWTVKRASFPVDGEFDFAILADVTDAKGEIKPQVIAETFGRTSKTCTPNAQANAEIIVRAVNAHDDLVKALALLLHEVHLSGNEGSRRYGWPTAVAATHAALAKARGA